MLLKYHIPYTYRSSLKLDRRSTPLGLGLARGFRERVVDAARDQAHECGNRMICSPIAGEEDDEEEDEPGNSALFHHDDPVVVQSSYHQRQSKTRSCPESRGAPGRWTPWTVI